MERNEQALTPVEKDEIEIDFRELFHTLWQKFWVLLLALAIGAAFAAGLTLITTPKYQATSMIYVFNRETDLSTLASLQIGSQLTADFEILATSRPVVEKVIRQLGLEMSYDELVTQIKIGNPEDAHMLTITVTDSDPQQAANISNALSDALSDRVEEVIDTDRPNQVEEAVVPHHPSSPSMKKNVVLGGLLGLVLAAVAILVRYFLDDTIQTEEDVSKYLGFHTLASIPLSKSSGHGEPHKNASGGGKSQVKVGRGMFSGSAQGGKRQSNREVGRAK